MRTSHRLIRKRILEAKSKISDENFFASKEYRSYLTDLAEAATKRYQHPYPVEIIADPENEMVAFTDFSAIHINVCNEITWSFPTRKLRSLSVEGMLAHELGHVLFTDQRIWNTYCRKLIKGTFYPRLPTGLDAMHRLYAMEIQEALQDENDTVPASVIMRAAQAVRNIMEDGYVERRYAYEFPGRPAQGIALNNLRFAEMAPDLGEMIDRKYYDHNIVLNMLIQYVRVGEVNNLSEVSSDLMDAVVRYMPMVDSCLCDDDIRSRCEVTSQIIIDLWPIMQRSFDALRDEQQKAMQQQQAKQNASTSGTSAGGQGSGDADAAEDDGDAAGQAAVEAELESQMPITAGEYTGRGKPVPANGAFQPGSDSTGKMLMRMAQVIAEETERIAPHVTQSVDSEGDGGQDYDNRYEGYGYDSAADDIERLLDTMAEHQVNEELEQELSEELQREAGAISYGNAHRNIHVTVNRMSQVAPEYINMYHQVAPPLLQLSKRLQRSVEAVLRDKRQGGKQTGLLAGKRLNQHALYRDDGRIFCNSRLPTEPIDLSVAMLVDESGSMCGNDRITRARATAIVVQDFCESLGIPLMIMGHTAWSSHVQLFSYSDFDSIDRLDRYRLMDMSARDCNRDGAALRFVAEKLYQHPSEMKLLLIICDGQPNDDGYSGSAAEADLRGIKLEYARKGVQIYAAAIGDDRENIERIYGNGFMDITDLNQLPIILTELIKRNLPQ